MPPRFLAVWVCLVLWASGGAVANEDGASEHVAVAQDDPGLWAYRARLEGPTDLAFEVTWWGRSEGERLESGAEWFMGFVVADGEVVRDRLYGIAADTGVFAWAGAGPAGAKDDVRNEVFPGSIGGWSRLEGGSVGATREIMILVASSVPHFRVDFNATWTYGVVETEWVLLGHDALLTIPLSDFTGGVGAGAYAAGSVALDRVAEWHAEHGFLGFVHTRAFEPRPGLEGEWSWSCTVSGSQRPCQVGSDPGYYGRFEGLDGDAWSFHVHRSQEALHDPLVVLGLRLPWAAA